MTEHYERDRTWLVKDPLLKFVLDGVRYSLDARLKGGKYAMTWEQGREIVLSAFPDAEIILEAEQQAE